MPKGPDRLSQTGKPLFFKLSEESARCFPAPEIRPGRAEAVRVYARTLADMQKEAVAVSARSGAAWRLASDEGAYLDGHDAAPCPLSFFSTGMVCMVMEEIEALARARGIALDGLTLVQDNFYTMRGSALKGTMTGGAKDVRLEVSTDADISEDALRELACDAVAAAPVSGLVWEVLPSLFTLTHNGRELAPAKARPVYGAPLADPGRLFAGAAPGDGDWAGLIERGAMTPRTEETTTLAGGSLAEEQDRILHLRVTCARRADGVKRIEQHLFNPHGSIFTFLSDEAPEAGGQGRAPDAASYLSAGIAFCFLTQLGRYARIVKSELTGYACVQDAHLSAGGASGGGGRPGAIDPLETHVYLTSGEDGDFAKACLDMSEQTCFLHALCRTALKTRVTVRTGAAAEA